MLKTEESKRGQALVYVVDDDDAVRDALAMLLDSVGLTCVAYSSADEFLTGCEPDRLGCVILDIRMSGMNGLELQNEMIKRNIHLPVIFITGHGDVPMAVRAMKAGAVDFLEKPFNDQQLLDLIQLALQNNLSTRDGESHKALIRERYQRLTPREREIMALVVTGKSNKEIAQVLDLSPRTVEVHRARVMEKMETRSLPELIRVALATGITETASKTT